jgi:hypothetical protein
MPRDTLIQVRRGTLAQWLSTNPTLANGELGFITDQCRIVVGKDEVNFSGLWNSDSCVIPQTGLQAGGGGTINDVFKFVNVSGSQTLMASGEATLNLIGGNRINLVGVSGTNTITFDVSGLVAADISDFTSTVSGIVDSQFEADLIAGNNIELAYNTVSNQLAINTTGVVTANSSGDVLIGGDLSVVGDLSIQGSSTVFNSTTVNIGDNLITLNIVDVVPSGGIRIVRSGVTPTGYANFLWQEHRDRWEADFALHSPNIFADTISATTVSGALAGRADCATNVFVNSVDHTGVQNALLLSNITTTGCNPILSDTTLYFNSSGNVLVAPSFSGALLGRSNVSTAVDVIHTDASTDYNIVLVSPPGSGSSLFAESGLNLYYNPSQNKLYSSYINSPFISGASVDPGNAGINSFILTNFYIRSSKIDGGSP